MVLTYFQSLQCDVLCFVLIKEIQSSGESSIKDKDCNAILLQCECFLGDLSYPLELLQARQVVRLVVDYVIQ